MISGWIAGTLAAALFAYLLSPFADQVWSWLVEWIDVSHSAVEQGLIAITCLICIVVGTWLIRKAI